MNILDIINKKRLKQELTYEELEFSFMGYYNDLIKDYQMTSLLMAISINGMTDKEILALTDIFIKSGEILDLSSVKGITVDKHSTGGVGDKTTLIVASICASLGVKVPKMSGRGLGHTGGTIDKLESIPGFKVNLSKEEFINQLNKVGACVISQTANLAPLDKKIYALRDVSGTVESIPLIAVSIMSKKIASGADKILLDIKVGSGALLKNQKEAREISRIMKLIGEKYHKEVKTLITYMDIPLGTSIGNSLEIIEVIRILLNQEKNYLTNLSKALAITMVEMGLGINYNEASNMVNKSLESGSAYKKFLEIISSQGGDLSKLKVSKKTKDIFSTVQGHIINMDALKFGKLSCLLGAGRLTKDDIIDPGVGIVLRKTVGDDIKVGDILCTLYLKEDSVNIEEDIESFYTIIPDTSIKEEDLDII